MQRRNTRRRSSHDQSFRVSHADTACVIMLLDDNKQLLDNLPHHPCATAAFDTIYNITFHNLDSTAVTMDLRQFVPRYTSEATVQFYSGEFSKTSPPRARHVPLRTAPPIIPARNPLRVGKAPRPLETVAKIWDPKVGDYVTRQLSGDFAYIKETSAQVGNRVVQRSISTNTFQHKSLLISASGQRSSFGRSLHEEIEHLRQSFIELQDNDDDVFAPNTTPRRSASSATLRTPVRNFSLPTYSPPNKQFAPIRTLRRVRSRSVNLGHVAEASELPDYPVRRESLQVTAVAHRAGTQPEPEAAATQVVDTSEVAATLVESKTIKQTVVVEVKRAGTCKSCKSTRKALAMNPVCCIDCPERGRLCFHCWSGLLADGVSKQDRKNWLCCLLCRKELAMTDAKRLANRGTILK
jgi:hypothetical protein